MALCDRGQLYGPRRSRQGRPTRTRGSLQAFGAGLGCLWSRGIPSADSRPYDPSAAQPAAESLQRRRSMLRFGVFFNSIWGGSWPHSGESRRISGAARSRPRRAKLSGFRSTMSLVTGSRRSNGRKERQQAALLRCSRLRTVWASPFGPSRRLLAPRARAPAAHLHTIESAEESVRMMGAHPVRSFSLKKSTPSRIALRRGQRRWDRLEPVPSTPYIIHTTRTALRRDSSCTLCAGSR